MITTAQSSTASDTDVQVEEHGPGLFEATLGHGISFYRIVPWTVVDEWCDDLGVAPLEHGDGLALILHDLDMYGSKGQGLGRTLFEYTIQHAASLGASDAVLEAIPSAVSFWQHMGFELVEMAGKNAVMRRVIATPRVAQSQRVEPWQLTRAELMKSLLFHATPETFEGPASARSHGGDDFGILWTAETPDVAQSYLMSGGVRGGTYTSMDSLFQPAYSRESTEGNWAREDHRAFPRGGEAVSILRAMGFEPNPEYDKVGRIQSVSLGPTIRQVEDFLRSQGYEIGEARDTLRLDFGIPEDGQWDRQPLRRGDSTLMGTLFVLVGKERLHLYDAATGEEGDLTDPQYNHFSMFQKAYQDGYDGVVINDFGQSPEWGNFNHRSIGLFPRGVEKLEQSWLPVEYADMNRSGDTAGFAQWHHDLVQQALERGESVPPEVVREYPDLAGAHPVTAAVTAGQFVPPPAMDAFAQGFAVTHYAAQVEWLAREQAQQLEDAIPAAVQPAPLQEALERVRRLADEAAAIAGDVTARNARNETGVIPLDLAGWRYVDDPAAAAAAAATSGPGYGMVRICVDPAAHRSTWRPKQFLITIAGPHAADLTWLGAPGNLARYLESVRDEAHHEITHAAQSLLQAVKGLRAPAGLPRKLTRSEDADAPGVNGVGPRWEVERIPHEMLDVEFWTDLEGTARHLARHLIDSGDLSEEKVDRQIRRFQSGRPVFTAKYNIHSPFEAWKNEDPDRWRKAVKVFGPRVRELVRELAQSPRTAESQVAASGVASDRAVHLYVSPRQGQLTPFQAKVRRIAYDLKQPLPEAIHFAAAEMAPHVPAGATLVPIPGHTGDTFANRMLAEAIAAQCSGVHVVDALGRSGEAPSARQRHVTGAAPVTPEEHLMVRRDAAELVPPVILIDNVTTSGHTFEAARQALGGGQGLAFASERGDRVLSTGDGDHSAPQPRQAGVLDIPPRMYESAVDFVGGVLDGIARGETPKSVSQVVPIELEGWRYAPDPAQAERTLAGLGKTQISVVVMPWTTFPARGIRGEWFADNVLRLYPDGNAIRRYPKFAQSWLGVMQVTIRHELTHAAHDWMTDLGIPGQPSNPEPEERGTVQDVLLDDEFQPYLSSWIENIVGQLSRTLPPSGRRYRLRRILEGEDPQFPALRVLRDGSPDKWRRAVREITKAVSARVPMPEPNPIPDRRRNTKFDPRWDDALSDRTAQVAGGNEPATSSENTPPEGPDDDLDLASPENRQWLYHATTSDRIPAIRSRGILPSRSPRWKSTELADHSVGAVFFSRTIRGALFYAQGGLRNGDLAYRIPEDGDSVPGIVVLRVPWREVYAGVGDVNNPDPLAHGDIRTVEAVPSERIEAGIDNAWVPLRDVRDEDLPWLFAQDSEDGMQTRLYDQRGNFVARDSAAAIDMAWRLAEETTPKDNPRLESDYGQTMHRHPIPGPINAASRLRWPALEARIQSALDDVLSELADPDAVDPDAEGERRAYAQAQVDHLRDELVQHRSANRVRLYRHLDLAPGRELGLEAVGTSWTTVEEPSAGACRVVAEVPLGSVDWVATVRGRAFGGSGPTIELVPGAPLTLVHAERPPVDGAGEAEVLIDRPMQSTASLLAGDPSSASSRAIAILLEGMSIEDALRELGLEPGATPDEVKRRRRQLARERHPDLNPGQGDDAMKRVNDAADSLLEQGTTPRGRGRRGPSRDPGFTYERSTYDAPRSSPRDTPRERPPWVTDPRDSWNISQPESFADVNYCKKRIWEEASKYGPTRKISILAHDGTHFRLSFSAMANESVFPFIADVMRTWNGSMFGSDAVLVQDGDTLTLIWTEADGDIVERVPTEEFDDELRSPPALDRWMVKRLRGAARTAIRILRDHDDPACTSVIAG